MRLVLSTDNPGAKHVDSPRPLARFPAAGAEAGDPVRGRRPADNHNDKDHHYINNNHDHPDAREHWLQEYHAR